MRQPHARLLPVLALAWSACASPQLSAPLAPVTDGVTAHTVRADAPARIAPAQALERLNALLAGLTLHRHGDVLDVYLAMKTDDGMREEFLTLERAGFGD